MKSLVCCALLLVQSISAVHAQVPFNIQDSLWVNRVHGSDTMPESAFAPAFTIRTDYDTARIEYLITEIRLNGVNIPLDGWRFDSVVADYDAADLSNHTRTRAITVHTGDTISLFRELTWYHRQTKTQDTGNFYALDTLDYAIELNQDSSGARLALLDSMGVLRRTTVGPPTLYGIHSIMAQVQYVVPSSMNGTTVFLRVMLYERGTGPYFPSRYDHFTVGISGKLTDTAWAVYRDLYNVVAGKPKLTVTASKGMLNSLRISPNPSNGVVDVDYSVGKPATVSVIAFDASGKAVFASGVDFAFVGSRSIRVSFDRGGAYVIGLIVNGRVVSYGQLSIVK
jgi:hypothetical protein